MKRYYLGCPSQLPGTNKPKLWLPYTVFSSRFVDSSGTLVITFLVLFACRGSEEEALAKSSYSSPHYVSQHPICISAGILEHSMGARNRVVIQGLPAYGAYHGWIDSLESIPGIFKGLKISSQLMYDTHSIYCTVGCSDFDIFSHFEV